MRTVELEENEFEMILLALGYAAGAAMKEKERAMANMFLYAANALNRGNPNWTMYALPEGLTPGEIVRRFMASLEGK